MTITLQPIYSEFDSPDRQLQGLSDMAVLDVATRSYLLVAGAADGGIGSYEIMADNSLVPRDDLLLSPDSGTQGVAALDVFTLAGTTYVLPSGEFDDNQSVYTLGSDGLLTLSASYSDAAGTYSGWSMTASVDTGGATYLFGGVWGRSGFFGFDVGAGAVLTAPRWIADTAQMYLGDITAMESAVLHGKNFLFIASGQDTGLESFEIAADGSYIQRDRAPPSEGGFSGVTDLVAVDGMDRAFVIMASAGTDSLLVFRVSAGGRLQQVQTATDTLDTRFAGVQALETFDLNGRDYLLAGGADDGISLFEVTYKGQLKLLDTVADTAGTALQNVTSITARVANGEVTVFAGSATDQGFTQFVLSVPNGDNLIRGGPEPDSLTGTALDDTIFGHGKADTLYGLDGDDRLVDGRGPDVLWGGAGADIFEFVAETRTDRVMDFEIGIDRLDMSDYAMLYSYTDIAITPTANGAMLEMNGDTLILDSIDGTPLDFSMFSQDDFIFG